MTALRTGASSVSAAAAEHTPGPWVASQTYPDGDWCIHAQGIPWQLAYLAEHSKITWPLEANARLIAAAPDMFAALTGLDEFAWTALTADCAEARDNLNSKLAAARRALAKARAAS